MVAISIAGTNAVIVGAVMAAFAFSSAVVAAKHDKLAFKLSAALSIEFRFSKSEHRHKKNRQRGKRGGLIISMNTESVFKSMAVIDSGR